MANKDEKFLKQLDNEFVKDYDMENDRLIYSKDFYIALYKKLQKGLSDVEAYEALGFDTKVLGVNRAYAACKRARTYVSKNGYTVKVGNYDGSVDRSLMGNLTPEEEYAFFKARTIYLESLVEAYKKKPVIMQEILSSLKKK